MANIKSAEKRIEVTAKKAAANKAAKTAVKTEIKNGRLAVANNAENMDAAVLSAVRKVDKAVSRGIMHKNTAARRKSQLMKGLNAAKAAGAAEKAE